MKSIRTRVLIITSLILLGISFVYSQNKYIPIEQNDIEKLNKRISKLFDKSACGKLEGTRFINIFFIAYNGGYYKNEFINGDFEQYIKPTYFKRKFRKLINSQTLICKENGELIALSEGRYIYCLSNYNDSAYLEEEYLADKILELDIKTIYYIGMTPLGIYFGISTEGLVYLISTNEEKLNTYLIEDFPDKNWSELFRK